MHPRPSRGRAGPPSAAAGAFRAAARAYQWWPRGPARGHCQRHLDRLAGVTVARPGCGRGGAGPMSSAASNGLITCEAVALTLSCFPNLIVNGPAALLSSYSNDIVLSGLVY